MTVTVCVGLGEKFKITALNQETWVQVLSISKSQSRPPLNMDFCLRICFVFSLSLFQDCYIFSPQYSSVNILTLGGVKTDAPKENPTVPHGGRLGPVVPSLGSPDVAHVCTDSLKWVRSRTMLNYQDWGVHLLL